MNHSFWYNWEYYAYKCPLWKDRFEWYKTVKRIEVVGGEPMYIKQWHKIFDELIELDYAKDIVLDM